MFGVFTLRNNLLIQSHGKRATAAQEWRVTSFPGPHLTDPDSGSRGLVAIATGIVVRLVGTDEADPLHALTLVPDSWWHSALLDLLTLGPKQRHPKTSFIF